MSEKQSPQMAFPYVSSGGHLFSEGMTLRDYFAAKAMASDLLDPEVTSVWTAAQISKHAYDMADAMLEARK